MQHLLLVHHDLEVVELRPRRRASKRFLQAFRLGEIATVSGQFKPSPLVAVFDEINDEYTRQVPPPVTPF